MSIWEVRGNKQRFTISQIMLWVAFDRGLRLAEKRCLPCPNRAKWLEARDNLYEEIMEKGLHSLCGLLKVPYSSRRSRLQHGDEIVHSKLRSKHRIGLVHFACSSCILHRPIRSPFYKHAQSYNATTRGRRADKHWTGVSLRYG